MTRFNSRLNNLECGIMGYEKKINSAIKLLRSIPTDGGPIEVSYSGGKDSDVILELAKMADIPFEAIYKQTSIDPPGTTKHALDNGVTIYHPKKTFFQLVAEKGSPSRFKRFCCEKLKEYKIYDRSIQGIRRAESPARAKRYKEPSFCRLYGKGQCVETYLPILEWTDADVERFIEERGIRCHPLYYDEEGRFHVERRLGCIGCPLQGDNGLSDFLKYPRFFRQYVKSYQSFLDNHRQSNWYKRIDGNALNACFYYLFCKSDEEYQTRIGGGLFPDNKLNVKDFMEDYFGIEFEGNDPK